MPSLTIRAATDADVDALVALAEETFPLACPPSSKPESIAAFIAEHLSAQRFVDYLGDADRAVLVAVDADETLLGWAMLVAGEPSDADVAAAVTARPTIELSKFYTRRATHGAGVSGPLMQAVVDVAAATGAETAWLGVNEENARAIRFYEKHGFVRVGTKRFRLGERLEHDFVLERPLRG
ncbi:GNAT family N-acetyltransferase [Agromyces sp. MMS24-JH15]|uniref:GNAT family N-acetyltransferase n=1 Tax=Agromyces sp. MMS24-JH15 TaxID=3243765 RepID=UPI00374A1212